MQRLVLKITDQNVQKEGDLIIYSVRGNGIKFEQKIKEGDRSPENMKAMNENFRNCLRYVKHFGGYVDEAHEDHKAMMYDIKNKWSSTNAGVGIKPIDDLLTGEFKPF